MRNAIFIAAIIVLIPVVNGESNATEVVTIDFVQPFTVLGETTFSPTGYATLATLLDDGKIRFYVDAGSNFLQERSLVSHQNALEQGIVEVEASNNRTPQQISSEYIVIEEAGWIELAPSPREPLAIKFETEKKFHASLSQTSAISWAGGERFNREAPRGTEFSEAYRGVPEIESPGVLATTPAESEFVYRSETATFVGWTNAVVTCISVSPCPSSDDNEPMETTDGSSVREVVFIQFDSVEQIEASVSRGMNYIHSPELSVSGLMAARLPQASGQDCQVIGCDGKKTIRLDGDFTIDGLRNNGDGRLSANIDGDIQTLILDEVEKDPALLWTTGAMAAATAMAIVASILFKTGFFALFTRISADEALEHPRRKRIFAYVCEHPGATFREIVRNTRIPAGTTRHHLNVMRRSDLVVEKPHKSTLRFFENHGKFDASWDTVVMLREEPLAELHAWLMDHPDSPQKSIIAAMEARGHSRGTVQHRLSRLVDARLVSFRPQGRLKLYTAHAEPMPEPNKDRFDWNGLDASWPQPGP